MTARVAADYADTSVWTIRRHVKPCGRRGRQFIFAIEDVERWMRGQPIASASPASPQAVRRQDGPTVEESLARIRELARSGRDDRKR